MAIKYPRESISQANPGRQVAKKSYFAFTLVLVVGSGFEPLKAESADLQSGS